MFLPVIQVIFKPIKFNDTIKKNKNFSYLIFLKFFKNLIQSSPSANKHASVCVYITVWSDLHLFYILHLSTRQIYYIQCVPLHSPSIYMAIDPHAMLCHLCLHRLLISFVYSHATILLTNNESITNFQVACRSSPRKRPATPSLYKSNPSTLEL
jgi:hypothetical protein